MATYDQYIQAAATKRKKAHELRQRGKTFDAIGKRLKCSRQRAQQMVSEQAMLDKGSQ